MVLVSNFAQTVVANEVQALQPRGRCHGGWQCQSPTSSGNMPKEALLWVAQSKTEEEKRLLLELARTWSESGESLSARRWYQAPKRGPMPRLHEDKTFDAVDPQRRMPISWRLSWDATEAPMRFLGRFVRVTDEDGEEVYRAPLTNRV